MEPSFSSVSGYFVAIFLLQMVVPTSEHFTVSSSRSHQVVMVGEHVELSCQLSPPQSAEHMNVGWYRDHYSQLVQEYEHGKKISGGNTQDYMNRTVLLKDALGVGRMTLRIYNISIFDEGQYHCFFKDGDTYEEAIMDLKVAALGLDMHINLQPSGTNEFMVECSSGGWFPKAEMEWRDSRGNMIPSSSKIFFQDADGLLHLKMSVLLKNNTDHSVTCCFRNPVTGQEKRAGVVLPDILFNSSVYMHLWLLVYLIIVPGLLILRIKVAQNKRCILLLVECFFILVPVLIFPVYWIIRNRVSVSVLEDLSPFYSTWMYDMSYILSVLMCFFTILIFGLLCTLKGFL
ncbi:PREDICTED: putative selection and upkeep of intraepithelial T-cells protein 1 homolog [Hipposideros armiger]|uniref:Selection and upkeep of intraepithelial T-cells protein 1 homolog n=1 Tax=Hipposideros armiger TaxID=186990 RepID=A0A8B7PVR1_HIPAR|nr:PREDICTED: putative selection and upkeep of intraepithelial T-cells protein 1 homolog [Hipposideros armiger]